MGRRIGRAFRRITRVTSRIIGASPAGAILGGIGKLSGQKGIAGLSGPTKLFGDLAQKFTSQLGGFGLGFPDVCATPTPFGTIPIPYPNISSQGGGGFPGASAAGGGGGALGQAQSKFDSAMSQLTSGKKLDQATMMKLQQQIQEANRMFEMINSIQKAIHDSLKSMIRNIQA